MNANIKLLMDVCLLFINGTGLKNKNIEIKIPSAQIKSGLLLAALNTKGKQELLRIM